MIIIGALAAVATAMPVALHHNQAGEELTGGEIWEGDKDLGDGAVTADIAGWSREP
jgi:hypothetical protein